MPRKRPKRVGVVMGTLNAFTRTGAAVTAQRVPSRRRQQGPKGHCSGTRYNACPPFTSSPDAGAEERMGQCLRRMHAVPSGAGGAS